MLIGIEMRQKTHFIGEEKVSPLMKKVISSTIFKNSLAFVLSFCTWRRNIFSLRNIPPREREKKRLIKCFPRTVSLTKMGKRKKTSLGTR